MNRQTTSDVIGEAVSMGIQPCTDAAPGKRPLHKRLGRKLLDNAEQRSKANSDFNATYAYDGTGLRQSKTVNGTTTNFTWDVSGGLPMLTSDGTNHYIYGADGTPLSQIDANNNVTWFGHDTQANTKMLMRDDAKIIASYDYDPYGNVERQTGKADTPLRFGGQYQDAETGLVYLRARYHDPKTNQFLTVDPLLPVTRSAYGYANNDGINYSDPSGMIAPLAIGAAAMSAIDIGLTVADAYSTINTVTDPCASLATKGASAGLFALGAVTIGGGYSTALKWWGTRVTTSSPVTTKHGADRLQSEGFTDDVIAATKSERSLRQADGATVYVREVSPGKFDFIVEGDKGVITAHRNFSKKSTDRIAKNYGWEDWN